CIVKLEAAGRVATRQIEHQFDILQTAGLKADVDRIIGKESLRVREVYERSLESEKIIDRHLQHGRVEPRAKRALTFETEQEGAVVVEFEVSSRLVRERLTLPTITGAHAAERQH